MNSFLSFSHNKIKQGDIKEFEKLFRKLYSPLCQYAFRYLKDTDAAEEVVQDLFYTYWKNKEVISINISLKSYLYQGTKNKCLKEINHEQVKNKYANEIKHKGVNPEVSSSSMETAELQQLIEKTLNQLPSRCREIFELNRFEGMKYHEIAKRLSISIKTVEANMGKALKLFRANLKQFDQIAC